MTTSFKASAERLYSQTWLLLTLTALFWAGNAIAGQLARGEIAPFQLVLARWVMVAGVLWWLFGHEVRAHWEIARGRLVYILLVATTGFTLFNGLFYMAALYTSGVNIGILQGSMPALVLVFAFLAYGTRVSAIQGAGVIVTMAGVALVATGGAPGLLLEQGINLGDGLMLLACCCYSSYATALQKRPAMPGRAFFTLMAIVSAVTAVPPAIAEAAIAAPPWPTWEGWLVAAFVAIFPSCLAQLFFLRGVDLIGPGRAGVYVNLVPVFGALLSIGLLGQVAAPYHAVSLLLVLSGIWLAQRGR
jgi:drug/metabolite transporter (DMT)-like permease